MSISDHAPNFLLKGALLFQLWYGQPHRPTRDADLLGFGPDDIALVPSMKLLAETLAGSDTGSTAGNDFLAWRDIGNQPQPVVEGQVHDVAPNTYRYSDAGSSVDIRLSSIHVAKGQTHLATLTLETFNRSHFLHSLVPWLLGTNKNGGKCTSETAAQRLLQIYVAMTRPTHLLCLALRRKSLGVGEAYTSNQEKLIAMGWRIEHLAPVAVDGH